MLFYSLLPLYAQFHLCCRGQTYPNEGLRNVFAAMDTDRNGYVNNTELRNIFYTIDTNGNKKLINSNAIVNN